jgi:hypothetical protein
MCEVFIIPVVPIVELGAAVELLAVLDLAAESPG